MQNFTTTWRFQFGMVALGIMWLGMVTAGFALLKQEAFTPVENPPSAARFPPNSAIRLASNTPTLLLFLHPQCPCSRASVHELDEMMATTANQLSVVIIFALPSGVPAGWEKGDLWNAAARLPGVRVVLDKNGVETRRFRVKGSGHTLLYAPSGRLLFGGGITPSRGHEGDNPGQSAIISLVQTGHASISQTPVFGCSLL